MPWIADQLKILARIPDSVCLEVRIVDRIINFRSPALVEILLNHIPLDRCARFTNWSGTQIHQMSSTHFLLITTVFLSC